MSLDQLPKFQQQQYAFTANIRDPESNNPPSEIEQRRMSIYAELFYNGTESHLSANFPVLKQIMSDDNWQAMMRDFFIKHRCETALFTEIGIEFIEYLQSEREPHKSDWPFMTELAHYEYVELAVSISNADEQREALEAYDTNGDLLSGRPVVAATAWNLSYLYPVQNICEDFLPTEPSEQANHLVVYRDRSDDVHFLEINTVTQRLLTLLKENPQMSGLNVLTQIAEELQHPQPEVVIEAGSGLMQDLRERNVILGSRAI